MTKDSQQNPNWHARLLQARGWLFVGAGAAAALVVWLVRH